MDDVVGAVEKVYIALGDVSKFVRAPNPRESRPGPNIVPPKISRDDHYLVAPLEHADIDRNRHHDTGKELG